MRLMVNSHPSGVVRRHEMRDRRPFSSALWQGEQDLRTISLVIGMPASSSSFSFSVGSFGCGGVCGGCCATSAETTNAADSAQRENPLMVRTLYPRSRPTYNRNSPMPRKPAVELHASQGEYLCYILKPRGDRTNMTFADRARSIITDADFQNQDQL